MNSVAVLDFGLYISRFFKVLYNRRGHNQYDSQCPQFLFEQRKLFGRLAAAALHIVVYLFLSSGGVRFGMTTFAPASTARSVPSPHSVARAVVAGMRALLKSSLKSEMRYSTSSTLPLFSRQTEWRLPKQTARTQQESTY